LSLRLSAEDIRQTANDRGYRLEKRRLAWFAAGVIPRGRLRNGRFGRGWRSGACSAMELSLGPVAQLDRAAVS
jgi:hypothetical protein